MDNAPETPALSVSEFVVHVNAALDVLTDCTVVGEVSDFKIAQGKWVVFQLRDETSSVGCFLPVWQYHTQIEDGMLIRVRGTPRLREKGFFSFTVSHIAPAGEGALKRAYELLKQKLTAEGLFAPERKRALPRLPQHVALITSREAAAYSDFLKVLKGRLGGLTISVLHTHVQGDLAPGELTAALTHANEHLADVEVIVMVRGGGSPEDLQAFNDELVVRAVAASRIPTLVGVGHERDVSLAELAADVRASTPSNAAELLVPSRSELLGDLTQLQQRLRTPLLQQLEERELEIRHAALALGHRVHTAQQRITATVHRLTLQPQRFKQVLAQHEEGVRDAQRSLRQKLQATLTTVQEKLEARTRLLSGLSPERVLARGYSITRTATGAIVRRTTQVSLKDKLITTLVDGTIRTHVEDISKNS